MPDFGESANDRDKLVAALRRATDDGANSTEDVADAILAEWAPAHDREKAVRAWNEGYAVGGAEMRMLLLDPPLKPIPNPYSRRES